MPLAAWKIEAAGPNRLAPGFIELEKNLEEWIQNDAALIDPGLLVLRRQMHVEGGILDLLCVDLQGRLTVIEIKRGMLIRETIAQAIDYASSIAALPEASLREQLVKTLPAGATDHPGVAALLGSPSGSEREIGVVVVGLGLDRMIDFLGSRFGFPIRAVTFDAFDVGDGVRVIVRDETEVDAPVTVAPTSSYSVSSVVATAGGPDSPNGRRLLQLANAAEDSGLYVRPYKWSLMFTPMAKKTRYLITVWKWGDKDELALSYSATAVAEFFPIAADRVQQIIGLPEGRHSIRTDADSQAWEQRIRSLFDEVNATGSNDGFAEGSHIAEAPQ